MNKDEVELLRKKLMEKNNEINKIEKAYKEEFEKKDIEAMKIINEKNKFEEMKKNEFHKIYEELL